MHCGFANCEIELVPGTYEVSIHQECLYCATYGLEWKIINISIEYLFFIDNHSQVFTAQHGK